MNGSSRKGWWAGALALLVLLALAAAVPRLLSSRDGLVASVAAAVRKDLVVLIQCDATLEPPPGGELRAPEPAKVDRVLVAEGQRVARGTPLVVLGDPALSQRLLDSRAEVRRLAAEEAALSAELESALAALAERTRTVEADERLLAQGAIPRATLDAERLALVESRERVRAARSRLASLSDPSGRLALARESAARLERRVAALTLVAPLDGLAYGLPRRTGELVAEGQLTASVADRDRLRVRARVDQPDLPRVKPGQRLTATFDGLPGRRFTGTVREVSPGIVKYGGRDVGEVLAEIADPSGALPLNGSVNVEIVAGESARALVIPRAALLRAAEKRQVFRLEEGRARRREVTVGLVGLSEVEVTSGLSEGDLVLLPAATPFAEGMKIRPRS